MNAKFLMTIAIAATGLTEAAIEGDEVAAPLPVPQTPTSNVKPTAASAVATRQHKAMGRGTGERPRRIEEAGQLCDQW